MRLLLLSFALIAYFSLPAFSEALPPDVYSWKSGVPAIHGKVKDQGDVGFCWANAWTSFLESKLILEKKKYVDLSALYVGRASIAEEYLNVIEVMTTPLWMLDSYSLNEDLNTLSHYQDFQHSLPEFNALKPILIRRFQSLSEDELEGNYFLNAYRYGIVPQSSYESPRLETPRLAVAGSVPVPPYTNLYETPEYEEDLAAFIEKNLLEKENIERYLKEGRTSIERDFDRDIGNHPISESDTFEFEGKSYTPQSFLSDYIGFQREVPKTGVARISNFDEVIHAIQTALDQRRPTLIGFTTMDDLDNNPDVDLTGIIDPFYCEKPYECTYTGQHAVMVVNSMKDSTGKIRAFIIQNSWGPIGADQYGHPSLMRAERGFFILTIDYLREAFKTSDSSFRYQLM